MTWFMRVLVFVLVVMAVFFGVAYFLPDAAHVERSIEIAAPPEAVFPHLVDYHKWRAWSPWADRDPDMLISYEGPPSGVGSVMHWRSEDRGVGSGAQEMTAVESNRLVRSHLYFGGQGEADAFLKLEPSDNGCVVTWGFDANLGRNPLARYAGLTLDPLIGSAYERGLAKLKAVVEDGAS